MPVEHTIEAYFVFSLQILIDDGILEDVFAIGDEEIAKKERKSDDEKQYILWNNLIGEYVDG